MGLYFGRVTLGVAPISSSLSICRIEPVLGHREVFFFFFASSKSEPAVGMWPSHMQHTCMKVRGSGVIITILLLQYNCNIITILLLQ